MMRYFLLLALSAFCILAQSANVNSSSGSLKTSYFLKVHPILSYDTVFVSGLIKEAKHNFNLMLKSKKAAQACDEQYRIVFFEGNIRVEVFQGLPYELFAVDKPDCPLNKLNFFSYCICNGSVVFFPQQDFSRLGVEVDTSRIDKVTVSYRYEDALNDALFTYTDFTLDGESLFKGKRLIFM